MLVTASSGNAMHDRRHRPDDDASKSMNLRIPLTMDFSDEEIAAMRGFVSLGRVQQILASAPLRAEEPVSRRGETHYGARSFVANEPVNYLDQRLRWTISLWRAA
jgi:hypothetical protein